MPAIINLDLAKKAIIEQEEEMVSAWLKTVIRSVRSLLIQYEDADENRKYEILHLLRDEYRALPECYQQNTSVRDLHDLWWEMSILLTREIERFDRILNAARS